MSAIDQAFIRAYEVDDSAEAPATLPVGMHASRRPAAPPAPPQPARTPEPAPAPHFRVYAEPDAAPPAGRTTASATERRPLSAFAQQTPAVEARFRPALEVDAFRWSPVSDELVTTHRTRWHVVIDELLAADDRGCSLIGVAGAARKAGATTVAASLARLLVEAGKTVVIVDGDFASAGLARSLGLGAEIGWEDVLAGRASLADAVIQSLDDRIAVLPLTRGGVSAAEKLETIHASITAGVLRYHYDITLFDLGAIADEPQRTIAARLATRCRLDGMLLTTLASGPSSHNPKYLLSGAPELASICLGVVENQSVVA